jgi:hypothetical protein
MQTADGDSIRGTANFNTVALSFLNASGATIETAPFVPVNGKDFPVLDGRDPNLVEDAWVEGVVNAIAPAGTAYVRISLFFIQLMNQGGASWFDDVSLVRLTPDIVSLDGDFNNDGKVDAADYIVWRKNTANNALPNDNGVGTQAERYALWTASFGTMAGSGGGQSNAAVPEPSACVLALVALVVAAACRRRPAL